MGILYLLIVMYAQPIGPLNPANFWLPVVVLFVSNTLLYIFCQVKKDNSHIDTVWGLMGLTPMAAMIIN